MRFVLLRGFVPVWELKVEDPLAFFFYGLELSIGMHAFPSTVDLTHIWRLAPAESRKGNLLALASYRLVALLYVLNFARGIWADPGYGIAIGIVGPLALFKALA